MRPRIYDPGDLEQYDCLEIAAFDGSENIGELTEEQEAAHDGRLSWCVFLHLSAGHITDLADGFATRSEAIAFGSAVEALLPNLNKQWKLNQR